MTLFSLYLKFKYLFIIQQVMQKLSHLTFRIEVVSGQ